jgi:hypothetical protein
MVHSVAQEGDHITELNLVLHQAQHKAQRFVLILAYRIPAEVKKNKCGQNGRVVVAVDKSVIHGQQVKQCGCFADEIGIGFDAESTGLRP